MRRWATTKNERSFFSVCRIQSVWEFDLLVVVHTKSKETSARVHWDAMRYSKNSLNPIECGPLKLPPRRPHWVFRSPKNGESAAVALYEKACIPRASVASSPVHCEVTHSSVRSLEHLSHQRPAQWTTVVRVCFLKGEKRREWPIEEDRARGGRK